MEINNGAGAMTQPPPPQFFFIIGAMKAGTTSLYKYLTGHPELFPSMRKEPRVFRDSGTATSQRKAFDHLFTERRRERWCFEASTAYSKFPRIAGVPRRIQSVAPDARFIYLVRNPIDRTWSHYLHNVAYGRETRPFEQAIRENPQYLDISRYHLQLAQYFEVFPRDRVLVLVHEEMVIDPAAAVHAVCEFLQIDVAYRPLTGDVAYNSSSGKLTAPLQLRVAQRLGVAEMVPSRVRQWLKQGGTPLPAKHVTLTAELRERLVNAVQDDTRRLVDLLGRSPHWQGFA